MESSIYVKRRSFEVRKFSDISFVLIAFCQPQILHNTARDVTDILFFLYSARRDFDLFCLFNKYKIMP